MDLGVFQSALKGTQAPASAPVATPTAPKAAGGFASAFAAELAKPSTTTATPAAPAQPATPPAPVATQDWNGQKIPANIPTKNLVAYDQATGTKQFKMSDVAGGGVYSEDAQGNIVHGGHTNYGGEKAQEGMQRDDIIPAGVGGVNSNKDNIRMVPLDVAHDQDTIESLMASKVKSGAVQPKAAISEVSKQKQEIAAKPRGIMAKIGAIAGDVGSGLKTGAKMFTPTEVKKNLGINTTPKPPHQTFAVGEGLPEGTGNGTKGGAQAAIIREEQIGAQPTPQTPTNMNFADGVRSLLQAVPRAVGETAMSFLPSKYQNEYEPVTGGGLMRFILGDEKLKPLAQQAVEAEATLNKNGIKGKTATTLAVLGVATNDALQIYPVTEGLGKLANQAILDLADAASTSEIKITFADAQKIVNGSADVDPVKLQAFKKAAADHPELLKAFQQEGGLTIVKNEDTSLTSTLKKAAGGQPLEEPTFTPKTKAAAPLNDHPTIKEPLQLPGGQQTTVSDTTVHPELSPDDFANRIHSELKTFQSYVPKDVSPEAEKIIASTKENLGKVKSDYLAKATEEFGSPNVVSADTAKYALGLGKDNAHLTDDFHPASSAFAKMLYNEMIENKVGTGNNTVLFTGGGTGAGKTSSIRNLPGLDQYPIVYDSNFTGDNAIANVQKALGHGYNVEIKYVHRSPVDAFENGVIPRVAKEGRVIDIELHLERHQSAFGMTNKFHELFGGNPKVEVSVIDNSNGKGKAFETSLDKINDFVHNGNIDELRSKLYESANSAKSAGKLSDAEHQAIVKRTEQALNNGNGGSPKPAVQRAGAGEKVATMKVADLADIQNSLSKTNSLGVKPGGIDRAKAEITAGKSHPVNIRTLEDGSLYIEDGRHRIEAARQLGLEHLPVNDVTEKYAPKKSVTPAKEKAEVKAETAKPKVTEIEPDIHGVKGGTWKDKTGFTKREYQDIMRDSQKFPDSEMEGNYRKFVQRFSKFRNHPPEDYEQFIERVPEASNWFYSQEDGEPQVFDKFVERYQEREGVMLAAGFNPGVDKFIDQELKPVGQALAAGAKTVYTTLQAGFSAFMDGLDLGAKINRKFGGETYAEIIKAIHAPEAEEHEFGLQQSKNLDKNFNEVEKYLNDKFTDKDLVNFNLAFGDPETPEGNIIKQEAEKSLPDELKDPIWNQIRKEASDMAYGMAKSNGIDLKYFEDYFYGAYKDTAKVNSFLDFWRSTDAWTKEKAFPTVADASAFGLELKDNNPITNIKKEVRAISHRVAMKNLNEYFDEVMAKSKTSGVFDKDTLTPQQIATTKKIEDVMFNDKRFDPALAKMVNNLLETNRVSSNFLAKSLRNLAFLAQRVKFLGSIFHMTNEVKAMMSDQMLGIFSPKGYKTIGKSLGVSKEWQKTPEYKEYLNLGGGHGYSQESQALSTRSFAKFLDRANRGNYLGATTHAVIGTVGIPSSITHWMFDDFIPRMKFERFRQDVVNKQAANGGEITDAEKINIIINNNNVYGEMNERLFGRRSTLTSVLRLVFSAPGYGEGNFRVAGKAAGLNQDVLGKVLSKEALRDFRFKSRGGVNFGQSGRQAFNEAFSNYKEQGGVRSARFIVSSFLTSLVISTVGTYLMTHKLPKKPKSEEDVRDLFKIQTNTKDGNGDTIFFDMMTHEKDYWSIYGNLFFGHPGKIPGDLTTRIGNATSGVYQTATDLSALFQNKTLYDYAGNPIYNKTDTLAEKSLKLGQYLAGELQPISAGTFTTANQKSGKIIQSLLVSYFGITSTTSEEVKDLKAMRTDLFDLRNARDKKVTDLDKLYKENPAEALKQQKAYDKAQTDKIKSLLKQYGADAQWDVLSKRLLVGDLSKKKTKTKTKAESTSATSVINQILGR